MSFNGSGTFVVNSSGQPVVTGTVISSTVFNAFTSDIATGLSTAICKDGQTTLTGNIPFNSNRITGLGAGTARTDAIQYAQVQDGAITYLTAVAGTNTVTATGAASLAAYATGQEFTFIPANSNTGATTLNINSIGAKSIFFSGKALIGGEIRASVPVRVQYDGTQFNIIGPGKLEVLATKSSDQSQTSNTTLTNDNDLSFPIAANEEWVVNFYLDCGAAMTTTGIKVAINTPSGATINTFVVMNDTNYKSLANRSASIAGAIRFQTTDFAGFGAILSGYSRIANGANAGSVTLQWAQDSSSGTATTVRAGSYMLAKRK